MHVKKPFGLIDVVIDVLMLTSKRGNEKIGYSCVLLP